MIYGSKLLVDQDSGSHTSHTSTKNVSLRYVGQWRTATCSCFADKTTHFSNTAGAAVVVSVNVSKAQRSRRVAIVMDTAPKRGAANVVVDGVRSATVDTSATQPTHRVVVWAGTLKAGLHRIRLVNDATAGRPRVDFDAVVTN